MQNAEIWVERGDAKICALLSDERAFLMFLRNQDDPGFSSRNPTIELDNADLVTFESTNGQKDQFPRAWTYSQDDAFRTLESFAATGKIPDDIHWNNDAGDGRVSPNLSDV